LRSVQNQARRGFAKPTDFDVRFYSIAELRAAFADLIGSTSITPHCFFGLGWIWSDYRFIQPRHRPALVLSELLIRLSRYLPLLAYVADSVYCVSRKAGSEI
jgi:hypothetical protein